MAKAASKRKRRGWSLGAEAPAVENSHIAHFEFVVKNGYIWSFPKADGYSIGIGVSGAVKGRTLKSILGECGLFGVEKTTKQFIPLSLG